MMERLFVYIGTYTLGNSQSEGIYVYQFDPSTGSLSHVSTVIGIENPSFLKISREGRFLYAVSEVFEAQETPGGALTAYSIDQQSGALNYLNSQSTHGACPCHLNIDQTGQYLMVSNYMGGNIAILPVKKDGSLRPASDVVQHEGCSNVNPERQEGPHVHSVTLSPDNQFAIAADLGKDMLRSYKLNIEEGKLLSGKSAQVKTTPGAGPRHTVFHPNGRFLFLLNELGNTINSYMYDKNTGALKLMDMVSTLPEEYEGENIAADIHVHPNGKFLYASNRGHDSIVVYSIEKAGGGIKLLGHQSTLGEHPRNFGIDPTGKFLLVANKDSNNIVTFKIDRTTGLLRPNGQVMNVRQPVCLAFIGLDIN